MVFLGSRVNNISRLRKCSFKRATSGICFNWPHKRAEKTIEMVRRSR